MKKYLVFYGYDDETCDPRIMSSAEIFNHEDTYDYSGFHVDKLYLVIDDNGNWEMTECEIHGIWHDRKDPLRMEIVTKNGKVVLSVGYGTDH